MAAGAGTSASPVQLLHRLRAEITTFLESNTHIWCTSTTSARFLRTVDRLLAILPSFSPTSSFPPTVLESANSLLEKTMSRLAYEFGLLLDDEVLPPTHTDEDDDDDNDDNNDDDHHNHDDLAGVISVARPIQDYNVIIDALSRSSIHDLNNIARRMSAAGHGNQCAGVYSSSRKDFVEESVSRVGIWRRTAEDVYKMDLQQLEIEIQRWNQGIKVVFLILFPSERRLAERVFVGLPPVADVGFANACLESACWILEFAEGVAARSRQPELLFKIVDMYEVLRDLLPEIYSVFSNRHCRFLVEDYRRCLDKLGETIRGIFTDLEKMIRADPARSPIVGGQVHPITRYVINYLHATTAAWRTLEEIMQREETYDDDDQVVAMAVAVEEHRQPRPSLSFSAQVAWIIERLNANLEAKSRTYANEALCYLFLVNNAKYMVDKLGGSELKHMLGEEWISGQMARIQQWLTAYQRRSWTKVVSAVEMGGRIGSVNAMMQKLRYFNTYLDEVCKEQKGWVVADDRLRDETRAAVVGAVLPPYRSFLERGRRELRRDMNALVKYSPEQVEALIRDLFVPSPPKRIPAP